ncbi:hypothetical protein XBO1_1510015 [Xenorhabdus bovienii str. oregonense]|uniref:Uncharacterized protein n=1 Tax=Xenorhabdus bovienii str. oregonense TaxID=1398202 RepID=A0A077P4Z6_XENBV|nr:hypothetical protein XBO1_1510015 [Xenorhabdus bovienii str. oregonense]
MPALSIRVVNGGDNYADREGYCLVCLYISGYGFWGEIREIYHS